MPEPFQSPSSTSLLQQQRAPITEQRQHPVQSQPSTQGQLPEQSLPPAAPADPVSPSRAQQPRRDRFAAAREIPGNPADSDPLYTATDEELAGAAQPSAVQPTPEPLPIHNGGEESSGSLTSAFPAPAASVPAPTLPAPDRSYWQPEPPLQEVLRTPVEPAYQRHDPVAPPTAHRPKPAIATISEARQPAHRRAGPWVGGAVAAAVLGAAGFLYVNGLPSAITRWVSGSASQASALQPGATMLPGTMSTPNNPPSTQAPVKSRAAATNPHTPAPARVLDARQSFSPSVSIEKTSGPTFVPGGIMDGYLISAPRPQYPSLANLAGVQGKISFEAMISKAGEVEAVKVLGGPQLLRSAATDAVKQWQYRPFEVKGHPVEVRTIIRVDVASHAGAPAE